MNILHSALNISTYQFLRFLNPHEGYCWIYLAGGILFAFAVMLWRRRYRANLRTGSFLRLLGSRKLWFHRSTKLDMKLYLMHGVLTLSAYGFFEATGEAWRSGANTALLSLFGPAPDFSMPAWLGGIITMAIQFLAIELGYWTMHYAFHRVPFLWEVHKVHHSAEVMTPLSEWRQHPIEFVAFANVLTFANGVTYAVMTWLFGAAAQPLTLFEINALLILHLATFNHLRHSGVWIAGTGLLGRIFHSPAHHQIHHSTEPQHFNRNLGYALAIWDWAFGTLWIPDRYAKLHFGVPGEAPYRGVFDTLTRPLVAGTRGLRLATQAARNRPIEPAG